MAEVPACEGGSLIHARHDHMPKKFGRARVGRNTSPAHRSKLTPWLPLSLRLVGSQGFAPLG